MRDPKEVLAEELFSNIYPSSRSMPKSVLAYDKQFKAIFNAIEEAYEVGKKESEVLEQARLLGISGSKEAALEAELKEYKSNSRSVVLLMVEIDSLQTKLKEANEKLLGKDMAIYGTVWMKDGKRIDPNDVYKSPLEMELEAKLAECTAKLTSALEDLDETDEKMHEALNLSAKYKIDLVEALRLGDALVPYAQVSGSSHSVVYAWQAFRSNKV